MREGLLSVHPILLGACGLIVAIVSGVSLWAAINTERNADHIARNAKAAEATLRAGLLAECHRVQQRRTLGNTNNWRIIQAGHLLADHILDDALFPNQSRRERIARIRQAEAVRANGAQILYEPPTNCLLAVDHPLTYQPPPARPFPANYRP